MWKFPRKTNGGEEKLKQWTLIVVSWSDNEMFDLEMWQDSPVKHKLEPFSLIFSCLDISLELHKLFCNMIGLYISLHWYNTLTIQLQTALFAFDSPHYFHPSRALCFSFWWNMWIKFPQKKSAKINFHHQRLTVLFLVAFTTSSNYVFHEMMCVDCGWWLANMKSIFFLSRNEMVELWVKRMKLCWRLPTGRTETGMHLTSSLSTCNFNEHIPHTKWGDKK